MSIDGLRELVSAATGLRLAPRDDARVASAVAASCPGGVGDIGMGASTGGLRGAVRDDPIAMQRARQALVGALVPAETYFLRDARQMALVGDVLLPGRAADHPGRPLRLLSAGCSTGEEAYSLSMLCEAAPVARVDEATVLGVDMVESLLAVARAGVYGPWSMRGVPEASRRRWLERVDGERWRVVERVRRRVRLIACDLVHDPLPDPGRGLDGFDLILCRNVLVYLRPEVAGAVIAKLSAMLLPGGFLLTGHGEATFGLFRDGLRSRNLPGSLVWQKTRREVVPAASAVPPVPAGTGTGAWSRAAPAIVPRAPRAPVDRRGGAEPGDDFDAALARCWADADAGRLAQARSGAERLRLRRALDPRPHYLIAQLAEEAGERARAASELNRVLYLDPDFVPAYLDLAGQAAACGNPGRARLLREQAIGRLRRMPREHLLPPCGASTAGALLSMLIAHKL